MLERLDVWPFSETIFGHATDKQRQNKLPHQQCKRSQICRADVQAIAKTFTEDIATPRRLLIEPRVEQQQSSTGQRSVTMD